VILRLCAHMGHRYERNYRYDENAFDIEQCVPKIFNVAFDRRTIFPVLMIFACVARDYAHQMSSQIPQQIMLTTPKVAAMPR